MGTDSKLAEQARQILDERGIARGHSWTWRTVRNFLETPPDAIEFETFVLGEVKRTDAPRRVVVDEKKLAGRLSYRDPTGETAIRNILRGKR